jgi:hypothetical protein
MQFGLALAGICVSATPSDARTDLQARYDEASRVVAAADSGYRRALIAALDADDPYGRKEALQAIAAQPALVDDAQMIAALVRRLEEATPLQDSGCASMIARLDREYGGQGEELEYARCRMQGGTSNGRLAAKLLGGRRVFGVVAARVAERPESVEAVLAALGPSQIGPLSELAPVLAAARTAERQQALLRLAIATECDGGTSPDPGLMAPVVALLGNPAARVSRLAGLAVLRFTGCGPVPGALAPDQQRAAAAVDARLGDAGDQELARDLQALGPGAAPFMPGLLARFDRAIADRKQRAALVGVFRRIGAGARAATSRLAAVLRDDKQLYLRKETLAALAAMGPAAAEAKPALVGLLARDRDYYALEVIETLAAIDARLTRAEFDPLNAEYRTDCRRAGAIYMFNLGRDEDCYRRAAALERLAKRGGHQFRETGWRSGGDDEE